MEKDSKTQIRIVDGERQWLNGHGVWQDEPSAEALREMPLWEPGRKPVAVGLPAMLQYLRERRAQRRSQAIIERFLNLFDLDPGVGRSSMAFGFQFVGPGWLSIMEGLCERLAPLAKGSNFQITSVKSKLGTLRIAYRDGSDPIEAEVELAKVLAGKTCEVCGATGSQRTVGGWVTVRCEACAN
jgi:hypothetical protein